MINTKEIYSQLLSNSELIALVPDDNITNSYPNEVEIFPCIIVVDENQSDSEYADNKHNADRCSVMFHIYTKKVGDYVTTSEIGVIIAKVMNNDLWHCSMNGEISDPQPDVEHRVMRFDKSIFELNINS